MNGPASLVLSGDEDAVVAFAEKLAAEGRRTKRLAVSHAFHSARVEPVLDEFAETARALDYREPSIPIVSTVTGGDADFTDPDYWVRQVRATVRFADGVRALAERGVTTFLEVGPDAVLTPTARETAPDTAAVALLRRDQPEAASFVEALAAAHGHGVAVDWAAFFAPHGPRPVPLPTYPFQRERYWLDAGAADEPAGGHPLVGTLVHVAGGDDVVGVGRLAVRSQSWLAAHEVRGTVVVPASALVEAVARVGSEVGCPAVAELDVAAPIVVPPDGSAAVQVRVGSEVDGLREVTVHARLGDGEWVAHARGHVTADHAVSPLDGGRAVEVSLPEEIRFEAERYGLHPVLLDQVLPEGVAHRWRGVRLHRAGVASAKAVVVEREGGVALSLVDDDGEPVATVDHVAVRPLRTADLAAARLGALHTVTWVPVEVPPVAADGDPVLHRVTGDTPRAVVDRLAAEPADRPLVVLTRGAVAVGDEAVTDLAAAAAWGVARAAQADGRPVVVVDADDEPSEALRAGLLAAGIDQAAVRAGQVFAPRLTRVSPPGASWPDGTVLVVGDSRADHLAEQFDDVVRATTLDEVEAAFDAHDVVAVVHQGDADSARRLHETTLHRPLEAFVLVGPVAGIVGGPEEDAVTGAFLDALARHRHGLGLPGTYLAMPRAGEAPGLRPVTGRAALDAARAVTTLVAAEVDVDALRELPVVPAPLRADAPRPAGRESLADRLSGRTPEERRQVVLDVVRAEAAGVLGHAGPQAIDASRPFQDLGFDSMTAVGLRDRLAAVTGVRLPATVVFDRPTPVALADHVLDQLQPEPRAGAERSALAELDRLEAVLATVPDRERATVSARLRALLAALGPEPVTAPDPAQDLETASVDDVLRFIDNRLGRSAS